MLKNGSGENELNCGSNHGPAACAFQNLQKILKLEVELPIAKISGDLLYLPSKSNSRTQSEGAYFALHHSFTKYFTSIKM